MFFSIATTRINYHTHENIFLGGLIRQFRLKLSELRIENNSFSLHLVDFSTLT